MLPFINSPLGRVQTISNLQTRYHVVAQDNDQVLQALQDNQPDLLEALPKHYLIDESCWFLANTKTSEISFQAQLRKTGLEEDLRWFHIEINETPNISFIDCQNGLPVYNNGIWEMLNDIQIQNKEGLQENDIIKFGKKVIKLRSIVRPNAQPYSPRHSLGSHSSNGNGSQETKQIMYCHLCKQPLLSQGLTPNSPCNCLRNRNIHAQCFRSWLKGKLAHNQFKRSYAYEFQDLRCSECSERLLPSLFTNKQAVELLTNLNPSQNAIAIFEIYEVYKPIASGLLFVEFHRNGDKVQLGRDAVSDIILNDRSVSKKQAYLIWQDGRLYIKDRFSKRGSYKLIQQKAYLNRCKGKLFLTDRFSFQIHQVNSMEECKCLRVRNIYDLALQEHKVGKQTKVKKQNTQDFYYYKTLAQSQYRPARRMSGDLSKFFSQLEQKGSETKKSKLQEEQLSEETEEGSEGLQVQLPGSILPANYQRLINQKLSPFKCQLAEQFKDRNNNGKEDEKQGQLITIGEFNNGQIESMTKKGVEEQRGGYLSLERKPKEENEAKLVKHTFTCPRNQQVNVKEQSHDIAQTKEDKNQQEEVQLASDSSTKGSREEKDSGLKKDRGVLYRSMDNSLKTIDREKSADQ